MINVRKHSVQNVIIIAMSIIEYVSKETMNVNTVVENSPRIVVCIDMQIIHVK